MAIPAATKNKRCGSGTNISALPRRRRWAQVVVAEVAIVSCSGAFMKFNAAALPDAKEIRQDSGIVRAGRMALKRKIKLIVRFGAPTERPHASVQGASQENVRSNSGIEQGAFNSERAARLYLPFTRDLFDDGRHREGALKLVLLISAVSAGDKKHSVWCKFLLGFR